MEEKIIGDCWKHIFDYQEIKQMALVNFEDEGCPWTKVFGKYRVLFTFKDKGMDKKEIMVALENPEKPRYPIYVTESSIVLI